LISSEESTTFAVVPKDLNGNGTDLFYFPFVFVFQKKRKNKKNTYETRMEKSQADLEEFVWVDNRDFFANQPPEVLSHPFLIEEMIN
jgi:hypothetical protein